MSTAEVNKSTSYISKYDKLMSEARRSRSEKLELISILNNHTSILRYDEAASLAKKYDDKKRTEEAATEGYTTALLNAKLSKLLSATINLSSTFLCNLNSAVKFAEEYLDPQKSFSIYSQQRFFQQITYKQLEEAYMKYRDNKKIEK